MFLGQFQRNDIQTHQYIDKVNEEYWQNMLINIIANILLSGSCIDFHV